MALTGLGLLFALMRGPHEKGWIGWSGGTSFKLESKVSSLGATASEGEKGGDGGQRSAEYLNQGAIENGAISAA